MIHPIRSRRCPPDSGWQALTVRQKKDHHMKTIATILTLLLSVPLAFANYPEPGPAPKVTCPKAMGVATLKLKEHRGTPDSYVDRMTLLGGGKQGLWIIWFASPTNGYTILSVDMDGRVRKATQEEIDSGRGVSKKWHNAESGPRK
jgi:hypothetical protein